MTAPGGQSDLGSNTLRAHKGFYPTTGRSDLAAPRWTNGDLIGERRRAAPTARPLCADLPLTTLTPRPRADEKASALVLSASTIGHAALLTWLLVGWGLDPKPLDVGVTEVRVVTQQEYVRAVAASMVPAAATPVQAAERTKAASATRRLGSGPEDLVTYAAEPVASQPVRPVTPARVAARPAEPSATAAPVVSSPVEPVDPDAPAPPSMPQATPAEPATPLRSIESVAVSEAVEPLPEAPRATEVETAPRPPGRPRDLASQPMPEPEPQPAPEPQPEPQVAESAPAQGNAEIEVRQSTQAAQAEAQASAAAASYPTQVMQRLSRTRRDRVRMAGTAVISFTVADSGGLAALGVAQSSGAPEVDEAGLALVQRAVPFPVPPPGAQRNFSFQFTGD